MQCCDPQSVGRDSVASRYGLNDLGIESWWGEAFRTRPDRPWVLHRIRVSFLGVKRPGFGIEHPPPSRTEVEERTLLPLSLFAFMACSRVD